MNQYQPQDFSNLLGTQGFSDLLLNNHFTLYQGYVSNVNKLSQNLLSLTNDEKMSTPEYAEMKRRFGWEWNGMKLHEYYFGNMKKGGSGKSTGSPLYEDLKAQFGSLDKWEKDFRATGTMRGIGWTILYFDPTAKRFFNEWVNEHDMGHLAGCKPLIVLDVFEHAYMLDYGLKRADYIEAFFTAMDWRAAEDRYTKSI